MTQYGPGPRNLITDVPGLEVGHCHDAALNSGTTVLLCPPKGAIAGVDTRGGAPGTRETDALSPGTLVDRVHGVVLSGGSAFGLDAASGAQSWLAERSRGFSVKGYTVPIVPAAILFDLANGGNKDWGPVPPYRDFGFQACDAAGPDFPLGSVGAGYGAIAGPVKGGLGSASVVDPQSGYTVATLVAVNSYGSPYMPDGEHLWSAPFELAGELGNIASGPGKTGGAQITKGDLAAGANTTIGIVATDAPLSVAQAQRLALMAHDGYARALHPVHAPFDGDVIFGVSTGDGAGIAPGLLALLGGLGADAMTRAIGRAVLAASSGSS